MSVLLENMLKSGALKPRNVLHLGAEWCQEAQLYKEAGARAVMWVEASSENINHPETKKNLSAGDVYDCFAQVLVHGAVWHTAGLTKSFNIYNARSSNSLFGNGDMQKWYPRHHVERSETVTTLTVDQVITKRDGMGDSWRPYNPDLLVMDLQGAELQALMGAPALLNDHTLTHIVTEAMTEPLYEGGTQLWQLEALLSVYGFKKVDQSRHDVGLWYRDEIGGKIERGELAPVPQFDCLFVREPR